MTRNHEFDALRQMLAEKHAAKDAEIARLTADRDARAAEVMEQRRIIGALKAERDAARREIAALLESICQMREKA